MTIPEVAAALGVAPSTLRHQIANGRLRARKIGRDLHVTPREMERYRAESLGKPGRPPSP